MIRSLTIRAESSVSRCESVKKPFDSLSFFSVRRFSKWKKQTKLRRIWAVDVDLVPNGHLVSRARMGGFPVCGHAVDPGVQDLGSQYLSYQQTSERAQFYAHLPQNLTQEFTVCLSRGVAYFGKLCYRTFRIFSPSFMREANASPAV